MSVIDNGNRRGANQRKPADHLRAFVLSVLEPRKENEDIAPGKEGEQAQTQPFRGRDATQGSGEDKTLKFIIAAAGGVVVLVLLILGLSQKHTAKRPKGDAPAIGQIAQTPGNGENASNSSIVPRVAMEPTPADNEKRGKLTAQDLENTVAQTTTATTQTKAVASADTKTLGQVAPFSTSQSSGDTWAPKPYTGPTEQTGDQLEKAASAALAAPSLVFVANTTETTTRSGASTSLMPSLDLGTGARLSARLASVVTTAVDAPIIAIVEYSYEQNGEIIVPAGTKAVGHVEQADRSGYVSIKFDHLEMPDGAVLPIDALATDRNLGPLKGKVTGTHAGRNFLVRSFSDLGSAAAMLAGQNNTGGAISEDDLLRADLAENIGSAGDQQVMQLMTTEHPIVTIPAGTDVYIVFEKAEGKTPGGNAGQPARPTAQNLNELRQLLELQREMNQNSANNGVSQP